MRSELATKVLAIPDHLGWLAEEICLELGDERYKMFRHGDRHTRNKGCTGPLCTKALRDWQRERTRTRNAMKGKHTRKYKMKNIYVEINPILHGIKEAYDADFVKNPKAAADQAA